MELEQQDRPCLICKRQGIRKPVEVLPDGGIKWRVVHDDGKTCEWDSYEDIKQMLPKRPSKKKAKNQIIKCPICNENGSVNAFLDKSAKGGTWRYRIRHGNDYHHIKTQEQRDKVLEQIGRNIKLKENSTKAAVITASVPQEKRGRGRPPKPEPEEIQSELDDKYMKLIQEDIERISKAGKKKADHILEYAEATAKEGKIPFEEINDHITKKLKGLVSAGYVRRLLPAKYKNMEQKRRSQSGATSSARTKKRKWNIERLHKLSHKEKDAIIMALWDDDPKKVNKIAIKTLQELK